MEIGKQIPIKRKHSGNSIKSVLYKKKSAVFGYVKATF